MTEYKTKHAIGDLVYTANAYDVDRDVIKAIKIVGLKGAIKYGFKEGKSSSIFSYMWGSSDGYKWFESSEIFGDKESATSLHESLKAVADAEKAKEDAKEKAERKAELEAELKELQG